MKRFLFLILFIGAIAGLLYASGTTEKNSATFVMTVADDDGSENITDAYVGGFAFTGRHIFGKVILKRSHVVARGYGLSDSGLVFLMYESADGYITLDSAIAATLPCTLIVDSTNINVGGNLAIRARVVDSTSDTSMTASHKVTWDLTLRD